MMIIIIMILITMIMIMIQVRRSFHRAASRLIYRLMHRCQFSGDQSGRIVVARLVPRKRKRKRRTTPMIRMIERSAITKMVDTEAVMKVIRRFVERIEWRFVR